LLQKLFFYDEETMKEERRRRRRKKKQFWASAASTDAWTFFQPKYHRNIIRNISLSSLYLCDRIGAEPKKSSQSKRTFLYLRQNTNCIGHTLRRVSNRMII
jgi:hypothetical protein